MPCFAHPRQAFCRGLLRIFVTDEKLQEQEADDSNTVAPRQYQPFEIIYHLEMSTSVFDTDTLDRALGWVDRKGDTSLTFEYLSKFVGAWALSAATSS